MLAQGRPAYRVMTGRILGPNQTSESPGSEYSSNRPSGSDIEQAEASPFEVKAYVSKLPDEARHI